MCTLLRNPSPPPGDADFRRNMHILYLKPIFSLKPLEISLEFFNESLFVSPLISEDEVEVTKSKSPCIDEQTSVTASITTKNLQLIPEKERHELKNIQACKSPEETESLGLVSVKPKKHHKKKVEKSVLKHKAIKKEAISDDERKKYHKSLKHTKKKVYSVNSDSDDQEPSETKKRHKSRKHYKNISGSEDSDSDIRDSRKTLRRKSHSRHKKHREYNYSESESEANSKSGRHHRHNKNYKKEIDISDSDRSNSKGSADVGQHSRYFKFECDTPDSDSRRSERKYESCKPEPADESRVSESKYDSQFDSNYDAHFDSNYDSKYDPQYQYESYGPQFENYQDEEEAAYFGPDSFYCKVCLLDLNSESSYQSHMKGKKHAKAVKAQLVPEIVKESLATVAMTRESMCPSAIRSGGLILNEVAVLQSAVDNITEHPVIGLEYLEEIINGKERQYYCTLCKAKCMTASVLPHLIGIKHQMSYLKEIDFDFYYEFKDYPRKDILKRVYARLFRHENTYGRGKIIVKAVEKSELPITGLPSGEAKLNIKQGTLKKPLIETDTSSTGLEGPLEDFDSTIFDITKNDYYCKLCDAHMNNVNMYSAHKVGKRHLKNEKKTARERNATINSTRAPPNAVSDLEKMLGCEDVIVGLNFIRETQSANGSLYTCYLCGSSGSVDIIDHLRTLKHRIRYLETVNQNGSIPNSIATINSLEFNSSVRENLVLEECERIEKKYGRGKVEIYISKYGAK